MKDRGLKIVAHCEDLSDSTDIQTPSGLSHVRIVVPSH